MAARPCRTNRTDLIAVQLQRGLAGNREELGYAGMNLASLLHDAHGDPKLLEGLHSALYAIRPRREGMMRRSIDLLLRLVSSYENRIAEHREDAEILEALRTDVGDSSQRALLEELARDQTPRCAGHLLGLVTAATRGDLRDVIRWRLVDAAATSCGSCAGNVRHRTYRLTARGRAFLKRAQGQGE